MALEYIRVHAPRQTAVRPHDPCSRTVLWERDDRHPGGQASMSEGDTGLVFETKAVRGKIGTGDLVKIGKATPAPDPLAIEDHELASLGLNEGVVQALEKAGVHDVQRLVERYQAGPLDSLDGIGEARRRAIEVALARADFIPSAAIRD